MFELMLGEVPEGMREIFRGKLSAVIAEKTTGSPVTEEHVDAVVNEIVPEPFKSNILKKFKTLGDFDPAIIDGIVEQFGTSRDKLMFIMHAAQDEIGYLPREAMLAISDKTGIAISSIYNLATFYKTFRLERPGKHHVKLCCGTACHVHDTEDIGEAIEGKIAASDAVSIEKTLCLGCCDCAPVVEINGKVYKGAEAQAKIDAITLE
jgi:NADH-quinone oxidoreductase subunit E